MSAGAVKGSPVALVTGAGSGIGRAVAVLLSQRGWRLGLVGRRSGPLEETRAALGADGAGKAGRADDAVCFTADVGDDAEIGGAIDGTVGAFGRLDALVNNAGFAPLFPIGKTMPGVTEEAFRTNALGPAYAIARAWPVFLRQAEEDRQAGLAPRGGCVVNVSTMGTIDPFPGFFAYAASKAAVNLMARSCAKEGAEHGIRAFAVAPGAVETPMLRALFSTGVIPAAACLSPEEVARVIVSCIEGERDAENGGIITAARS